LRRSYLVDLLLCCVFMTGFNSAPFAAEVRNLRTGQQGNQAFAVYDLYGKPGEKEADVRVIIEIGSDKFVGDKLALSGDFGKKVKIGIDKKIVWDVMKDMPAGYTGDVVWDVDVTGVSSFNINASNPSGVTDSLTGIAFVPVAGGCFKMGDTFDDGEEDEKPNHEICLDSFLISKQEVTQTQWQLIMGNNPSFFKQCGKSCPVENVSWNEVQQFIRKLNARSDKNYRLPTEAEWEYAARSAGRKERYSGQGEIVSSLGWYCDNSGGKTHPVGLKKPNALGIYDMSGNVAEWVVDRKADYGNELLHNPQGPSVGNSRIVRGGSWLNKPASLRTASRSELTPSVRTNNIGFRLVLSLSQE